MDSRNDICEIISDIFPIKSVIRCTLRINTTTAERIQTKSDLINTNSLQSEHFFGHKVSFEGIILFQKQTLISENHVTQRV